MSDLITALKAGPKDTREYDVATLMREAADRITTLEAELARSQASVVEAERRGMEPTDAMVEAAAKAIYDHWQNAPGLHAHTWADCCEKRPGAAADFRAKARVGLVAALIPEAPAREAETDA